MRSAVALLLLAVALVSPGLAGADAPHTTASYIAGTHTVVGHVSNVPVFGTLPLTTATAVCQQNVQMPIVAIHITTPSFGGSCGIILPSNRVAVTVADAVNGALDFEYQAVDPTGATCSDPGVGASGDTFTFDTRCVGLTVWPSYRATYGTITLTSA